MCVPDRPVDGVRGSCLVRSMELQYDLLINCEVATELRIFGLHSSVDMEESISTIEGSVADPHDPLPCRTVRCDDA